MQCVAELEMPTNHDSDHFRVQDLQDQAIRQAREDAKEVQKATNDRMSAHEKQLSEVLSILGIAKHRLDEITNMLNDHTDDDKEMFRGLAIKFEEVRDAVKTLAVLEKQRNKNDKPSPFKLAFLLAIATTLGSTVTVFLLKAFAVHIVTSGATP